MAKALVVSIFALGSNHVWGAASPSSPTSSSGTNYTACVDNITWTDSVKGDGSAKCFDMQATPSRCTDYGDYSTEAARACPVSCGMCVQTPTEVWAHTLKAARGQAMLTQKMSKEFLLVAKKIEKDKYKKYMKETIHQFDEVAHDLLKGNPAHDIKEPPNEFVLHEIELVEQKWMVFKKLLEDNVDTADKATLATLNALSAQSLELLDLSDTVVSHLEDAARASGAITVPREVVIAIRQDTFIYKMATEAFLIGLRADVTHNLEYLEKTTKLFDDSHRGIIDGAEWAGVPTLEKFCTLYEMRDATYEWSYFKPLVDKIVAQKTEEESIAVALEEAQQLAERSSTLYEEMAQAAKLYEKDDGSCDHVYEITYSEWVYLIDNAGKQRYLGQQVSRLFSQIANQVRAAESKVDLTVGMTDTYNHLRSLLEGDKRNKIPSAPDQDIAHELYLVYKSWTEMQALISNALRTGDYKNPLTVSQVAELSRQILKEMDVAAYMYEALAKYAKPIVPGHYINVAGTQRKLFEKMSKEAALAAFGEDPLTNTRLMDETRAQFHRVHWELLKGSTAQASHRRAAAAPTADAAADPIPRTTKICLIQQMKNVSDHFDKLEAAVISVAAGNVDDIEVLIYENPTTYVAMDDAVKMYTAFAAPDSLTGSEGDYVKNKRAEADGMCKAVMDSLQLSAKERKEALLKSVQMQALLEQAQAEYLLASVTSLNSDKLQLENTVEDLQHWVDYFVYGKGKYDIPAPPSQELFDQMMELEASWDDLKPKFANQNSSRRLSAVEISKSSESMTSQADRALANYITLAEEDKDLPVQRLYIASNQLKLLQKMTKEALLSRLRLSGAREDLSLTINEFEKAQDRLKNGGGGIQAIIDERQDLLALHGRVENEWATFKASVVDVADNDNAGFVDMKTRLVKVSEKVEESIPAYAKLDPIVPPKPKPFPWHAVVFALMGFVVLIVIVSAIFVATKGCKGSNKSSKGKDLSMSSSGGDWNFDDSTSNQNAAQEQVQAQAATEEATTEQTV